MGAQMSLPARSLRDLSPNLPLVSSTLSTAR
jgi:hypothetical protein